MFLIGDKPRRNILVSCDHGVFIVNRFDHTMCGISGFLLDHGNNNTVEADVTVKALEKIDNPVVFDVGANIGTYSSWVSRWIESRNGQIYAFEPQRLIYQMFCGNMAINNIFNVHAQQLALGKEEKIIEIDEIDYNQLGSFGSFSLDGIDRSKYKTVKDKKQTIRVTTLDKFVEENHVEKVDFIKIDAEGMDLEVIEGGLQTIEKFKPDLYVEFLNLGSSKDEDTVLEGKENLASFLNNMGFETYVVGNDMFATAKGTKL